MQAYGVIRKDLFTGREFFMLNELAWTADYALSFAKNHNASTPTWAESNPILRISKINLEEQSNDKEGTSQGS
jgi:hypothetical protein